MSTLPSRDKNEEQSFIERQRSQANSEELSLLVTEAINQGRIQLAARLVQLIPSPNTEDPNLSKAMQAAQFWLVEKTAPAHRDFLDAWHLYQDRKRIKRIKNRMRPKSPFNRRRPR